MTTAPCASSSAATAPSPHRYRHPPRPRLPRPTLARAAGRATSPAPLHPHPGRRGMPPTTARSASLFAACKSRLRRRPARRPRRPYRSRHRRRRSPRSRAPRRRRRCRRRRRPRRPSHRRRRLCPRAGTMTSWWARFWATRNTPAPTCSRSTSSLHSRPPSRRPPSTCARRHATRVPRSAASSAGATCRFRGRRRRRRRRHPEPSATRTTRSCKFCWARRTLIAASSAWPTTLATGCR
mmetsp:Transcript_1805/g.5934  ORF Transcript_1805/g.5934 Transcript_1805/m.5934 type:complete len:238 (-) Transcript_1805:115-828(-)